MSGLVFDNPIVAGDELVRTAIRTPDYVPGVSGWTINRDGTAEFNDVTARGSVIVTDPDGSQVWIVASPSDGATILLRPATVPSRTYTDGAIFGTTFPAQHDAPATVIISPQLTAPTLQPEARITLVGGDTAANPPTIDLRTPGGAVRIFDSLQDTNELPYLKGETGGVIIALVAATSGVVTIPYTQTFATAPKVTTNIDGAAGGYARWSSRAINQTTTGFDLFLFAVNDNTIAYTGNIPVTWTALVPG